MNPRVLLFCLFAVLVSGCAAGPMEIRLTPPRVDLDGVVVDGDRAELQLLLHNRNDHPVFVERLAIELTDPAGRTIAAGDWPLALDIGPSNRDPAVLDATLSEAGIRLLTRPTAAARHSTELHMTLDIKVRGRRSNRTVETLYLDPAPGQPGRFRSAGGQIMRDRRGTDRR